MFFLSVCQYNLWLLKISPKPRHLSATCKLHVQNICLCAFASVCLGFVVATEYENEGKKETSVFQTSSYHIERIPGFVVIGPYSRWLFGLFSCNFGLSFFLLFLVAATR